MLKVEYLDQSWETERVVRDFKELKETVLELIEWTIENEIPGINPVKEETFYQGVEEAKDLYELTNCIHNHTSHTTFNYGTHDIKIEITEL